MAQEAQLQEAEPAAEAEPQQEPRPRDEQEVAEALPISVTEAFAQALEDAQAAGEPVADIAAAMVDGQVIKSEIIEGEATGRVLVITAEPESADAAAHPESAEAAAQPESDVPAKKPAPKGRATKSAAPVDSADK